jgi:protein-L-isoaspartate O-methyltransferase
MAACLAVLAGPGGAVLAIEKHAKLVERARTSIATSNPDLLGPLGRLTLVHCNALAGGWVGDQELAAVIRLLIM